MMSGKACLSGEFPENSQGSASAAEAEPQKNLGPVRKGKALPLIMAAEPQEARALLEKADD